MGTLTSGNWRVASQSLSHFQLYLRQVSIKHVESHQNTCMLRSQFSEPMKAYRT